ncbi:MULTISPECIES: DMT family transporter [unclassified Pseudomonas]|uniref:DMT family transporter n=1 Tax=unclassified Pseudomonas TaxID=196821 RepID=UPI00244C29A1|nr:MULTISPECIES: DMT family transporter [unclassified Pseudomonas]MDG9928072.1 DMT family transporter [Pseudomonas sp. GD04042]MDH0482081.1 DMT family transporter [Pseudomonas sp. GD04015]MDH0604024.1 DMT family transporter [Pseudomonas sp. GD03869]
MRPLFRPELVLLLGASFWGLGWLPLEHLAGQGLRGMPVVLYTYGLLCLVALPVMVAQQRTWWPQRRALAVICLCGGWATAGLVGALSEGDVVRAMLLFYLAPVWGLLGGWLLLGERLSASRVGALALAMLGIALTLGVSADTFRPLAGSDWLALSAGLAFACNNLATRAADRVPLASKAVVAFVGAALLGGLLCLLQDTALPPAGPGLWLQIALFGLFWLLAMGAAQYGFSHVEASRAAVLVVIELVVAVLTAAWFGERELGLREWCGGALVLLAALLAERPSRPSSSVLCEAKS